MGIMRDAFRVTIQITSHIIGSLFFYSCTGTHTNTRRITCMLSG